ncbi:MAG: hypothetical protein J6Y08_08070 [Clostridiales bacterium]|nr:hypothetical protein [Clostridiales bacterium]
MEKRTGIIDKKSISDFAYCVCLAFTMQCVVATIVMFITSPFTAEEQSRVSSIYATPGFLSKETILQFLIVALVTGVIRHIFMSDRIVKIRSVAARITLMFASIIAALAVAVWRFGWFRAGSVAAWLGFCVGAIPCIAVSFFMAYKTESKQNAQMNEALRKKQEEKE